MNKTGLMPLLQSPHIWRMGDMPKLERSGHLTGFEALDAELYERGWPKRGITELLCDRAGIGEVSVLLPALAAISAEPRCIAWINPPHLPYAPALVNAGVSLNQILVVRPATHKETLWAAELALRSGALGAVLVWLDEQTDYAALRRLHLAAEMGHCTGFVYRSLAEAVHPSPAQLRIRLDADADAETTAPCRASITLLKQRGLIAPRRLSLRANIRTLTPATSKHSSGKRTALSLALPRSH
jgi:hypothetical protein